MGFGSAVGFRPDVLVCAHPRGLLLLGHPTPLPLPLPHRRAPSLTAPAPAPAPAQVRGVVSVTRCTMRAFGLAEWKSVQTRLASWRESLVSVQVRRVCVCACGGGEGGGGKGVECGTVVQCASSVGGVELNRPAGRI